MSRIPPTTKHKDKVRRHPYDSGIKAGYEMGIRASMRAVSEIYGGSAPDDLVAKINEINNREITKRLRELGMEPIA